MIQKANRLVRLFSFFTFYPIMFDFIRTHNKIIQGLLFIFILPGFFLFGIEGFTNMGGKSETVAVVAGKKISQLEWEAAVKDDVERIRQNMPGADPKMFDSAEFKYASLEQLVKRRVLVAAAEQFHLRVSDSRLAAELLQSPEFDQLLKTDGTIDELKYKERLAQRGLTPQAFEARVRSDLSVQQMLQTLAKSAMVSASLADTALQAYFERREVQVLKFTPQDFAKKITPTDAEIEAFYKANAPLFQATENASIQYLVLDVESIKKTITLNDSDVKAYYDQNSDRLAGAEERKASHILIAVGKGASADERQKAKKQAEELLVQVKKAPQNFPDIAKKNSQDTLSATQGGDLGFFTRSSMVKPFGDAVFSMQPKQISDVVESDFGYHIIQLTEIKTPKNRSFAEMKPEIEAELKKQAAQKKFAEVAETFTDLIYTQPDSLKPAADKLKLEIQTANNVMRQATPGSKGVLANTKFLGVLFSSDAIEKKHNTEVVELGGQQMVAGRIVSYTPAQTMPLVQVSDRARALLIERLSLDLARKEGAAKLAELMTSPSTIPSQLSAPMVVSRDVLAQQSPKLVEMVLRTNATQLPIWLGVDLGGDQGYQVVRLNKVIESAGVQTAAAQNRDQYLQAWLAAEGNGYYEYLREKLKVQMKVAKPESRIKPT